MPTPSARLLCAGLLGATAFGPSSCFQWGPKLPSASRRLPRVGVYTTRRKVVVGSHSHEARRAQSAKFRQRCKPLLHGQAEGLEVHDKAFGDLPGRCLYALLQLRTEVFVVEQNCAYLELDGLDQNARHVWLEDDQGIVSYLRIMDEGDCRRIGRVVTRADARGHGHAARLLDHALSHSHGPWKLSAQTYLRGWY